ncbi:MAG: PmbA/TldA family metallopeptidase, partial [Candidatus Binatia bacterium]
MAASAIAKTFREVAPAVEFWSLRAVTERGEELSVVRGVVQPPRLYRDRGAMVTVIDGGGMGYAATADLTPDGLRRAAEKARDWAHRTAARSLFDVARIPREARRGEYRTPSRIPWGSVPLGDKIDLLRRQNERLRIDERVVDWGAALWHAEVESALFTSEGGSIEQLFHYVLPTMSATVSMRG